MRNVPRCANIVSVSETCETKLEAWLTPPVVRSVMLLPLKNKCSYPKGNRYHPAVHDAPERSPSMEFSLTKRDFFLYSILNLFRIFIFI